MCVAFGLVLVFVIPPFQVPDEQFHFYRAYQLSEGRWKSQSIDYETGDFLPGSLSQLAFTLMNGISANLNGRLTKERWAEGAQISLNEDERKFTAFTNPALYFPAGYVASASFIFAGRIFGLHPLALLYLGRLGNFLLASILILSALKVCPKLSWLIIAWMMIPTHAFLRSSLSPDGILNASVALYLSAILDIANDKSHLKRRWSAFTILVLGIFISVFKQVYFPIIFSLLAVSRNKFFSKTFILSLFAGILLCSGLANYWWSQVCKSIYNSMIIGNDASAQMTFVLHHPIEVATIISRNIVQFWPDYLRTMIGVVGWLDAYLPHTFVILYALFLAFICFTSEAGAELLSARKKMYVFLIFAWAVFAVALGIYITGMPWSAHSLWPSGPIFLACNSFVDDFNLMASLRGKNTFSYPSLCSPHFFRRINFVTSSDNLFSILLSLSRLNNIPSIYPHISWYRRLLANPLLRHYSGGVFHA